MKPIYKPKGAAGEYGEYALNIYSGCPHSCFYCYVPSVLHKDRSKFHSVIEPRKNIVEETRKQLEREKLTGKTIHLCFTCDPYPTGCDTSTTREIIKLLKEYGNHVSHSFIFWGGPEGLSDERKTILPTIGPHGMSTIDPGNIMDRGEKEYYTSKAVSLPDDAVVRGMYWEGVCTSTSWVEMELRCAGNADELERAAWQKVTMGEDLTQRKLSGVIQYRLALCAKCACGKPRITRVVVDW